MTTMADIRKAKVSKAKITTGFNPKIYIDFPIREVPICLIDEPRCVTMMGKRGYRSFKRVIDYARMLKAGKVAPPIELEESISPDGRPLKKPFTIYNGEHRYGAAVLAGRQTITAVIVRTEEGGPFSEDEYATTAEGREIKTVGHVEDGGPVFFDDDRIYVDADADLVFDDDDDE